MTTIQVHSGLIWRGPKAIEVEGGLIYRGPEVIEVNEADLIAQMNEFAWAEQFVRHYDGQELEINDILRVTIARPMATKTA